MDTAITTTNQSLSTTSVHTLSMSNKSANVVEYVVQNSPSSFIKNKRKNFNPRYSATTNNKNIENKVLLNEQQDLQQLSAASQIKDILTAPTTSSSSSSSSSSSLFMLEQSSKESKYEQTKTTIKCQTSLEPILEQIEKFKNLPVQHTSKSDQLIIRDIQGSSSPEMLSNVVPISESWKQFFELHRQTAIVSARTAAVKNSEKLKQSCRNTNISASKTFNEVSPGGDNSPTQEHHITNDPQSRIEFAYNAFHPVQELLNVYGLSISPEDIVNSFKKKSIGGCSQPVLTAISSTVSGIHSSSAIKQNEIKDDNYSNPSSSTFDIGNKLKNSYNSSATSVTKTTKISPSSQSLPLINLAGNQYSPTISLAPISKLLEIPSQVFQSSETRESNSMDNERNSSEEVLEINKDDCNNDKIDDRDKKRIDDTNKYFSDVQDNYNIDETGINVTHSYISDNDNNGNIKRDKINRSSNKQINNGDNDENQDNKTQELNNEQNIRDDNMSDKINSPQPQFNDNCTGNDEDSNISTTADLQSYDGSDDLGSCRGALTNQTDFDSPTNTTAKLCVKSVEHLLDKCSLGLFSPLIQLAQMQVEDKQIYAENIKNFTKFSSYIECKNDQCQIENLREHYHCYDEPCFGKILSKKEDIIRHIKWHKKRNESFNHGFLRFSSSDDCSTTFGSNCTHNRKQTHYHCLQPNCDKIYISTSDVQMHSNYHRKDSAIFQEGFQRYRATEECYADYCMFSGQRTTHFHCRRNNCRFTFKNKADMEKHKSYHIKDLQLAKDGFKKFLKSEACPFEECRFSKICNHIHCVRENCFYVLHSSGQLLSHKRKHERMDSEQAYRRFRMFQKPTVFSQDILQFTKNPEVSSKSSTPSTPSLSTTMSPELQLSTATHNILANVTSLPFDLSVTYASSTKSVDSDHSGLKKLEGAPVDLSVLYSSSNTPLELLQEMQHRPQQCTDQFTNNIKSSSPLLLPMPSNISSQSNNTITQDNVLMSMMLTNSANQRDDTIRLNSESIEQLIDQFFTQNCTKQNVAILEQNVDQQIEPLNLNFKNSTIVSKTMEDNKCNEIIECFSNSSEAHLHCLVEGCEALISRNLSNIAKHMQMHKLNRNMESIIQNSNLLQITSIEGFFNRKRGRPPKNRVVEVYNNDTQQSPQAIFTSFKLEKNICESLCTTSQNTRSASTITSSSAFLNDSTRDNSPIADTNHQHSDLQNLTTITSSLCSTTNRSFRNYPIVAVATTETEKKFHLFERDENCGVDYCIYSQQMHFHCNVNNCCQFVTRFGRSMDLHMTECHNSNSNDDSFSDLSYLVNNAKMIEKFQYIDTQDDCGVNECNYKKIRNHLHCLKCQKTIASQYELQEHLYMCYLSDKLLYSTYDNKQGSENFNEISKSPMNILSEIKRFESDYKDRYQQTIDISTEGIGYNSPRRKSTTEDKELDFLVKSESSEDEHVSVVKASGTYFPQNSGEGDKSMLCKIAEFNQQVQSQNICQRPFCKLKRKIHEHCELCSQAFSDKTKLKIHRLKHSNTKFENLTKTENLKAEERTIENENNKLKDEINSGISNLTDSSLSDKPQDSSLVSFPKNFLQSSSSAKSSSNSTSLLQQISPQSFMDNFCMHNLHLAQMALYQQTPFYYQNFYPFIDPQSLSLFQPEIFKSQFELSAKNNKAGSVKTETLPPGQFPFAEVAAVAAAVAAATAVSSSNNVIPEPSSPNVMIPSDNLTNQKRKAESYGTLMETIPPKKLLKVNKQENFKIFKDEPIPHGYLKFRFNEDCHFSNCGYRNHQSHFHCCRNDCFYSFCDKTRFVQHTARHERLDKLMGNDFKQYRANMRCGYENCAYNKNIAGQNNKSSHFHCLKCDFICSDTNKVVAHRRQHNKMEFIRMAGFRKVANNEKCAHNDQEPSNGECTYSLKQTHYHCLVCDCSVLSRAQLGSHRHRVS